MSAVVKVRPRIVQVRGVCRCCRASLVGTAYGPPSMSDPCLDVSVRALLLCLSRNPEIEGSAKVVVVAGRKAVSVHAVEREWCVCCNCGRDWHTKVITRESVGLNTEGC